MPYNYRVIQYGEGDWAYLEIHEVHYNKNNSISEIEEETCTPFGATSVELAWEIEKMLEALDKPILKAHQIDFEEEEE